MAERQRQRQQQAPGHHGARLPSPLFAAELEAAPVPGTVAAPDGGVAFEMCGDSAPVKGPDGDEARGRRPAAQATDADVPAQANPWPFYLEDAGGGGRTGTRADEEAGGEAGDDDDDAALAVPWPYHGPPLGELEEGPSATVYPQAARPASTSASASAGDAKDGHTTSPGATTEAREGAESEAERREAQSDGSPPAPMASTASDYPAPLRLTPRPHATATSPPPSTPTYKPYSPPPDREAAGQDASMRLSAGRTTGLAYRPYQPPREQQPADVVGTAPHHFHVPQQHEARTSSPPADPMAAAMTMTTASPSALSVDAAAPVQRPATASPRPPAASPSVDPIAAATTTTPMASPSALSVDAVPPPQRPAAASPHPPAASPSVDSLSAAPNTAHPPRPSSAASATGQPHVQYAPRPQYPPQQYLHHGISPYASPSPPVAGMTPVSPMQGYHSPPLHTPSPANSSYHVPQPTYASTPALGNTSPYQARVEDESPQPPQPPQPPRPQTQHATSGPTLSPPFSPLSPPPPYSYGGMPRPVSQPPQHSPYHSPPAQYPSPFPTQPTYAPGPAQGMYPPPPLPPRPAYGQFSPPPVGFGAGPANAMAYPPPPKTMYNPGPHPPPLPPRSGGSGSLFSSSSSARKWLDKTSQALESKLEAVLQGPAGPPQRSMYGPPLPMSGPPGPPGPPYQGGPPPPGWYPGDAGGPGQGGARRYA